MKTRGNEEDKEMEGRKIESAHVTNAAVSGLPVCGGLPCAVVLFLKNWRKFPILAPPSFSLLEQFPLGCGFEENKKAQKKRTKERGRERFR